MPFLEVFHRTFQTIVERQCIFPTTNATPFPDHRVDGSFPHLGSDGIIEEVVGLLELKVEMLQKMMLVDLEPFV